MAVLGPGGDRPAPRAAAAQRRTARRDFLASRGMPRSSRGSHAACCVGWRRQGKKVAAAPLRAGDRGVARTSWPNPPIERPDGRHRTPGGDGGEPRQRMIKVSRWHRGRRPRVSTVRGWSWPGWHGAVRRELAAAAIALAPDQQGSGGPGALGSDRRLQGYPAGRAMALSRGETGWRCAAGPG